MSPFPKFDPDAFLKNQVHRCEPAKAANSAKAPTASGIFTVALATLATLAAEPLDSEFPDLNYDYEERAAIIEYDGGLPRDEAERLAAEDCAL
jgi:hypothetical protein